MKSKKEKWKLRVANKKVTIEMYTKDVQYFSYKNILPPFQNTCPIFAMCTIYLIYFDHTFLLMYEYKYYHVRCCLICLDKYFQNIKFL